MPRVARLIPLAIVAMIAVSWALPLAWTSVLGAAIALAVLAIASWRGVTGSPRNRALDAGACAAVSLVGCVSLGYAVYALVHPGAFGPITRLGYAFLVATGLRLEGAAWLLLLCGAVSALPLLFPEPAPRPV